MLFPKSKGKRGVSTVLGTLIFVGILFTTVVPMYLVMRQADTMYNQKVASMDSVDQERAREAIIVYSYPLNLTSSRVEVRVDNMGSLAVTLERVWINDAYYTLNKTISSMETSVLGPYTVTLPPKPGNCSIDVKVSTGRGNVFPSSSGIMYYSDGTWYTASLGISVNIANSQGKYHIHISNMTWSRDYLSGGTEFGDVIRWFEVSTPGTYTVTVQKYQGGKTWVNLAGTPINVVIIWPGGSPIIYVYTSGIGV
jgi:archaellum component FlaF (FlaF/FlaG flagellin family)